MMRRFYICVIVCALHLPAFAQIPAPEPKTPESKAELYYRDALTLMLKNDDEGAFHLLRKVIELAPNHVGANYLLSTYTTNLGDYKIANLFMENVLEHDPNNYWARYMAINLYMLSGGLEKAIAETERMSDEYPNDISLLNTLASLYYYHADYEQALNIMKKIEQLGGDEHLGAKMNILKSMGKYEEAAETMEQVSDNYGFNVAFLTRAVELYLQAGNKQKAFELCDMLLTKEPTNFTVLEAVANSYREDNRMEDFYQWMDGMVLGDTLDKEEYAVFLENLANDDNVFTTKSDSIYKRQIIEKAMKQRPGPVTEKAYLLMLMSIQKDLWKREAREMFMEHPEKEWLAAHIIGYDSDDCSDVAQMALKHTSEDKTPYYYYIGSELFRQNQYEQLIALLEPVIDKIDVNKSNPFYTTTNKEFKTYCLDFLAEAYRKEGKTDKAYGCYEKIIEINPQSYITINNYAFFLALEKKNLDKAEKMMSRAIEEMKELYDSSYLYNYYDTYAFVLFQQKRYEQALKVMETALTAMEKENVEDEQKANVFEHAGDIYYRNKQTEKALDYWKKAKEAKSKSKTLDKKIQKKKYVEF